MIGGRRTPNSDNNGHESGNVWPKWAHVWPTLTKLARKAKFGQTPAIFCRIWRLTPRTHFKNRSPKLIRTFFEYCSVFCPSPRPAVSDLAIIGPSIFFATRVRHGSMCSASSSIFQRVEIERCWWESRRRKPCWLLKHILLCMWRLGEAPHILNMRRGNAYRGACVVAQAHVSRSGRDALECWRCSHIRCRCSSACALDAQERQSPRPVLRKTFASFGLLHVNTMEGRSQT